MNTMEQAFKNIESARDAMLIQKWRRDYGHLGAEALAALLERNRETAPDNIVYRAEREAIEGLLSEKGGNSDGQSPSSEREGGVDDCENCQGNGYVDTPEGRVGCFLCCGCGRADCPGDDGDTPDH